MVKKLILIFILFLISFGLYSKEGKEHDKDICGLFYDRQYADMIIDSSLHMNAICSSVFLNLDYNGNKIYYDKGLRSIESLNNIGVYFNFYLERLHSYGDGGSDHEKFTHLGWEPYGKYSDEIFEKWLLRKEILISLVVKVFDFSKSDESTCLKKLNIEKQYHQEKLEYLQVGIWDRLTLSRRESKSYSFAAILYYTHILGDIEQNSIFTSDTRISLQELCLDLEKHLRIVFGNKLNSEPGSTLISLIDSANNPTDILKVLQSTLQELLPKESFYKKTQLATEISNAVKI